MRNRICQKKRAVLHFNQTESLHMQWCFVPRLVKIAQRVWRIILKSKYLRYYTGTYPYKVHWPNFLEQKNFKSLQCNFTIISYWKRVRHFVWLIVCQVRLEMTKWFYRRLMWFPLFGYHLPLENGVVHHCIKLGSPFTHDCLLPCLV